MVAMTAEISRKGMESRARGERASRRAVAAALRQSGASYAEIGELLRQQFGISARVALRVAHGWSQRQAADEWNRLWPDDLKQAKNISYWELWPGGTGYEPSLQVIEHLAQLYQCSVVDLLADRGNYRDLDRAGGKESRARPWTGRVSEREAPCGWFIRSLVTLVRLDLDTPVAFEDRTIAATRNGLSEIDARMSVPRHPSDTAQPHGLKVELIAGGRLEVREQPEESQFRNVVLLARPLAAGEEHQYRMIIRIPPDQPMVDHLVHIPLQRSDHFRLTVRFAPDSLPSVIWLLNGVPTAVLRDRTPSGRTLVPDRFGELTANFTSPLQGQAYGIRWRY
jgi:transcriptional regulator with XRE-family HTH domain